jgi:hypothetical protein
MDQAAPRTWPEGSLVDAGSDAETVGLWLDAVLEKAWLGTPDELISFLRATVASPPALGHIDCESALTILRGLLLNADDATDAPPAPYREAVRSLMDAGVVGRNDMTAADGLRFLGEHRRETGRSGPAGGAAPNRAVVGMLVCGMHIGRLAGATLSPSESSELVDACAAAAADSSLRVEALKILARLGAEGMPLDIDVALAPCYSGLELYRQAQLMSEQFGGEIMFE